MSIVGFVPYYILCRVQKHWYGMMLQKRFKYFIVVKKDELLYTERLG